MPSIRCYAVFGAMVAVSAAACSAPADLTSLRAVQPITIDADPAEWDGKTTYLKDDGVSFGVQHDGDALYVNWVVSDPALERLVLGRGITLWIDPDGGDDPEVGIRFPLGLHERKRDPWNPDTPDGPLLRVGWTAPNELPKTRRRYLPFAPVPLTARNPRSRPVRPRSWMSC